jgi:hypothetical protein
MGTLKAAATALGIRLGAGPVDPSNASGSVAHPDAWPTVTPPPGFSWAFPSSLAAGNAAADLILAEFGGAIDLCLWAKGPLDLTHFGKFNRWQGPTTYDFEGVDETYAWAVANGMDVWISDPAYSGVPAWLKNGKTAGTYTAANVTTFLHDWYTACFSRYPLAHTTTLLNELFPYEIEGYPREQSEWSTIWYYQNATIGAPGGKTLNEFCATVCQWVKAANPNIRIGLNDFGLEFDPNGLLPQYVAWAQAVNALGAQITALGFQCHFFGSANIDAAAAAAFKTNLQYLDAAGFDVICTEFDIKNDSAGWATSYHLITRAIIESGVVTSLNFWHPVDPLFYGDGGALYSSSLGATSARYAVEDALLGVALGTSAPPTLAPIVDAIPSPTSAEPLVITGRVPSFLEGAAGGTGTAAGNLVIPVALAGSASGAATAAADLGVPARLDALVAGTGAASADLSVGVVLETTAEPHVAAIPSPVTDEPIIISGIVPPWAVLEGGATGTGEATGDLVSLTLAGDAIADSDASADLAASASHPLEGSAVASSAASLASGTHTTPYVDVVLSAAERTVNLHHGRVDVVLSAGERLVILERRAA